MKLLRPILLLLVALWALLRRKDAQAEEHSPGYYEPASGWDDDDNFLPRVGQPPEKRTGGASR